MRRRYGAWWVWLAMAPAYAQAQSQTVPPEPAAVVPTVAASSGLPQPDAAMAHVSPDGTTGPSSARPPLALRPWLAGPAQQRTIGVARVDEPVAASPSGWVATLRSIRVVELPDERGGIGPPPKRSHHALSINAEQPKRWLRGLGLDATDCAARFRMPSKLKRDREGTSVDIAAQLGMACKF